MKVGDKVMIANHYKYGPVAGTLGTVVESGPNELGGEVSVYTDDGLYYIKVEDLTPYERHPNSQRFHELLAELGELHDRKQQDYGRGDDPFANVRASEEWGIDGWVGAMVRLNDKVRRLQSLQQKGSLANESAIDSFMDIAVYALIARVLYEQEAA